MAGWSYRKRVKIAPGVTLNFSKNGVSTSVGPKGARLSFGPNGTYLNTSIPGTGLYRRQKIGGGNNKTTNEPIPKQYDDNALGCVWGIVAAFFIVAAFVFWEYTDGEFIGLTICILTTGIISIFFSIASFWSGNSKQASNDDLNLQEEQSYVEKRLETVDFTNEPEKYQILSSYNQCLLILPQIGEAEKILTELKDKTRKKFVNQIPIWQKKKEELSEGFEGAKYSATATLSTEHKGKYEIFCASINDLTKSELLYERCGVINRKKLEITTGDFNFIKSDFKTPVIVREDGTQLYFFPSFLINARNSTNFDVIPYHKITIHTKDVITYETDSPRDAEILGHSYLYENKDGSRDMRRTINPIITKVKYRAIKFDDIDGFEICVSNYQTALKFETALNDLLLINGNSGAKSNYGNKLDEYAYNMYAGVAKRTCDIVAWTKTNDDFKAELNVFRGNSTEQNPDFISMLISVDFVRCFMKLGKFVDFNNNDSTSIYILFVALNTNNIIEFENVDRYINDEALRKAVYAQYELVKNFIEKNPEPEGGFLVSNLLSKVDKEMQHKYLVTLHAFATTTAGVDNVITDEEQAEIDYISEKLSSSESDDGATTNTTNNYEQTINNGTKSQSKTVKSRKNNAADELQKLIGLTSVKEEITSLANYVKIQKMRQEKGMKTPPVSYHCVFTGNPGTGKTTVARIVAQIYQELGILRKGHLVETDRSGLVAEYVGQTAVKTNKIIDSALDGVLFIDEAYSLVDGGQSDYGKEAISTLLKRMEDDRSRLVVILAGYTNDMKRFIDSNPGLQSRFNRYIEFPDYTADELLQIFEFNLKNNEYCISDEARTALAEYLQKCVNEKDERFGNGRFVRNLFEKTIERQANRLSQAPNLTAEMLTTIEVKDLPE